MLFLSLLQYLNEINMKLNKWKKYLLQFYYTLQKHYLSLMVLEAQALQCEERDVWCINENDRKTLLKRIGLALVLLPFFEGSGLAFSLGNSGSVISSTSAVYATLKNTAFSFECHLLSVECNTFLFGSWFYFFYSNVSF